MRVVVDLPKVVKRTLQHHVSAWDPRRSGADQCIEVAPPVQMAYLTSEKTPDPPVYRKIWLRWSKEADPKTGQVFWKVEPSDEASKTMVRNLEMELTHHFDDPYAVA